MLKELVAGSVMEGVSMMFHGDYKKRCLLTILVSQILLLIKLISEIKYTPRQKDFSLHSYCLVFIRFVLFSPYQVILRYGQVVCPCM